MPILVVTPLITTCDNQISIERNNQEKSLPLALPHFRRIISFVLFLNVKNSWSIELVQWHRWLSYYMRSFSVTTHETSSHSMTTVNEVQWPNGNVYATKRNVFPQLTAFRLIFVRVNSIRVIYKKNLDVWYMLLPPSPIICSKNSHWYKIYSLIRWNIGRSKIVL